MCVPSCISADYVTRSIQACIFPAQPCINRPFIASHQASSIYHLSFALSPNIQAFPTLIFALRFLLHIYLTESLFSLLHPLYLSFAAPPIRTKFTMEPTDKPPVNTLGQSTEESNQYVHRETHQNDTALTASNPGSTAPTPQHLTQLPKPDPMPKSHVVLNHRSQQSILKATRL